MAKVLIFSAPSGSGKTTIVKHLLEVFDNLEFSISATSRAPRGEEINGKDYYFMSHREFMKRVDNDEFLEWEEVYEGSCYGTLRSEIQRISSKGHIAVFDVDVEGGINIKKLLGGSALSIFIMPPNVDELRKRLVSRATDSPEAIEKRVDKATKEINYSARFDKVIVNDDLQEALDKAKEIVSNFIKQ